MGRWCAAVSAAASAAAAAYTLKVRRQLSSWNARSFDNHNTNTPADDETDNGEWQRRGEDCVPGDGDGDCDDRDGAGEGDGCIVDESGRCRRRGLEEDKRRSVVAVVRDGDVAVGSEHSGCGHSLLALTAEQEDRTRIDWTIQGNRGRNRREGATVQENLGEQQSSTECLRHRLLHSPPGARAEKQRQYRATDGQQQYQQLRDSRFSSSRRQSEVERI
jgi:hypothetical protein